jgi:hypothetical protein
LAKKTPPPGARISAELSDLDYALPGTLSRRFMRCGKDNCRCKADPPILHGPYLHWTRTVAGKQGLCKVDLLRSQRREHTFGLAGACP